MRVCVHVCVCLCACACVCECVCSLNGSSGVLGITYVCVANVLVKGILLYLVLCLVMHNSSYTFV